MASVYLVLALLLLFAVLIAVRWVMRLLRLRRPNRPVIRCGRCGYEMTGLTVPRCPECGALRGFNTSAEELVIEHDVKFKVESKQPE